jgi:hypothetical protein
VLHRPVELAQLIGRLHERLSERLDFFWFLASQQAAPAHATREQLRSRDYLGFCLLGSWVFSADMECKFFIAQVREDLLHFVE